MDDIGNYDNKFSAGYYRGLREKEMEQIVTLIDQVLMQADNELVIAQTREEVKALMKQFPLYPALP